MKGLRIKIGHTEIAGETTCDIYTTITTTKRTDESTIVGPIGALAWWEKEIVIRTETFFEGYEA